MGTQKAFLQIVLSSRKVKLFELDVTEMNFVDFDHISQRIREVTSLGFIVDTLKYRSECASSAEIVIYEDSDLTATVLLEYEGYGAVSKKRKIQNPKVFLGNLIEQAMEEVNEHLYVLGKNRCFEVHDILVRYVKQISSLSTIEGMSFSTEMLPKALADFIHFSQTYATDLTQKDRKEVDRYIKDLVLAKTDFSVIPQLQRQINERITIRRFLTAVLKEFSVPNRYLLR